MMLIQYCRHGVIKPEGLESLLPIQPASKSEAVLGDFTAWERLQ